MQHLVSTHINIQLLGHFNFETANGDVLLPKGRKSLGILAYLIFHKDQPIQRTRLIDLFWHDREIEQGQGSLRQCLSEIRRALAILDFDILHVTRSTVMFSCKGTSIDLWDEEGRVVFDKAQPFLENLATSSVVFDEWLIDTRRYVVSSQMRAAELAMNTVDVMKDPPTATRLAQDVIALDPCNEPAVRLLMNALAAQDKLSMLKFAYEGLEAALKADGFEVSQATTLLYGQLRNQPLPVATATQPALVGRKTPSVLIQSVETAPTDLGIDRLTENLSDMCMERLVQLPELTVLDTLVTDAKPVLDQSYVLRCKIAGQFPSPVCHLHLTDTTTNEVIWSTRQVLNDSRINKEVQIVADIAASAILTAVERSEQRRFLTQNSPPETAYQFYLEAKNMFYNADQNDYMYQVEQRLERATQIDPNFVPAYAHLIQSYNNARFLSEPGRDLTLGRDRALQLARKLMSINALHPNSHIAMGWCQIWRGNYLMAERHIDRAIALGAYEAHRFNSIGTALIYLGRTDEGAACYDQAQERMLHEFEYQRTDYGELAYLRGNFDEALSWLETGERHAPYRSNFWRGLAFAQLGQLAPARAALEKMKQSAEPVWCGDEPITVDRLVRWHLGTLPLQRKVDMDLLMDGVSKAGVNL